MTTIFEFFDRSGWLRYGVAALLIGYGVAQYRININRAETRGEQAAHQKQEVKSAKVKSDGRSGASHRGVPVPGSVRDPGYRD